MVCECQCQRVEKLEKYGMRMAMLQREKSDNSFVNSFVNLIKVLLKYFLRREY